MLDHTDEVPFQYFLSFPSFYLSFTYFIEIFNFIYSSAQLLLLFFIICYNNNNVLNLFFSIHQTVFIIQNTFERFLCLFDLNLEESICINFYHLYLNILKLECTVLLKKYLHRCIIPSI